MSPLILAITTLFLFPYPAWTSDKIVVTATRSDRSAGELPFSTHSISAEEWEQAGARPEQAFANVPAAHFTVSGGPGQPRFLEIRGAKSEHTLVLIDGVVANDPLSPSRSFDFGQIPLSEIDRIEVIKGPQSVLYGSDAMGGVVQIFTKKGDQRRAQVEFGSYHSKKASVAAYGFHAGFEQSKGFSAADEREGNTEPDGHLRWNIGGKKAYALGENTVTKLQAQYSDGKTDTDRNGGIRGDSFGTFTRNTQFILRNETNVMLPNQMEWSLAGSLFDHDREDNTSGNDFYNANLWKLENIVRKSFGAQEFTGGLEYAQESGRSTQTTGGKRRFQAGAIYLQDQWQSERWQVIAGGRADFHSEHETARTARLGIGYWIVKETLRAKSSFGTGFKAPSLFQTYSAFGSPHLLPEKSWSTDAGLALTLEDWSAELTGFLSHFREMIDFNLRTNKYFNQAQAKTYGLELSLERRLGFWRAQNAFTLLRAIDSRTQVPLLRRPRFSNSLQIGYRKGDFVGANLLIRYVGIRYDLHPVLLTRQSMPAFTTLGVNFFHQVGPALRFVARGENLTNRHYQELSGYGVPGISGYAGIEADF